MSDAADPIAQRALAINIDRQIYGTFAEIGAGQEVARWFFSVGGAAGTVAKSMSAYDMKVSDAIYGKRPVMSARAGRGDARPRVFPSQGAAGGVARCEHPLLRLCRYRCREGPCRGE